MLYKFKSKASGDVIMTSVHGDQVMGILGKAPGVKGILIVADMPSAVRAMQAAIDNDEAPPPDAPEGTSTAGQRGVGLRQRLWPLLDMIKRSEAEEADIVWGI